MCIRTIKSYCIYGIAVAVVSAVFVSFGMPFVTAQDVADARDDGAVREDSSLPADAGAVNQPQPDPDGDVVPEDGAAPEEPAQDEGTPTGDGSDTHGTVYSQSPLVVDLKSTSDSGSDTTDNITSNTNLTFTVTGSRPFGGNDPLNDEDQLYIMYKNKPCNVGGAIPADGTGWGNANAGNDGGWSNNVHRDWRNSTGVANLIYSTLRSSYDISINMLLNDNTGAGRYGLGFYNIALTPGDGVKCFVAAHMQNTIADGGSSSTTSAGFELTLDRTAPVLTATRIGTGNTREYRVRSDDITAVTGRTKDNTASSACTTATDTSVAGWSDYTPGTVVGTAHNTNGRCVIVTDAAGNIAKQHLLDSATVPNDITAHAVAGDTVVNLFWADPGDNTITAYEYQQKVGSGSYGAWTTIPSSTATTTRHTFTTLTNGTEYAYKIRPKRGSVAGDESPEVTVTPVADATAPTLGTVLAVMTDNTVEGAENFLIPADTVSVTVPVTDPNPPSTAPTVKLKFGGAGTERTLSAGTPTVAYDSGSITTTYTYTYTVVNGDIGSGARTLRYKVTGVTDTAATPNSITDPATFTEVNIITARPPISNIGLQAGSDSGIKNDDITNDTTAPVIAFTLARGATITARHKKTGGSWSNVQTGSISVNESQYTAATGTITLPNLTAGDGVYEVEIYRTETGELAFPATYTFTLDTAAPPAASAVSRQTPTASSGVAPSITVSVTAEDGLRVRLYSDDTCTTRSGSREATVPTAGGATGTVSIESGTLSVGSHTIYASTTDPAGNTTCSSAHAAYTKDPPSILISPTEIIERNLDGAEVAITLDSETYIAGNPNRNHFTVTPTGVTGLSVRSATRTSNTVVTLTLAYSGGDFDTAGSFTVSVSADAHSGANPHTSDPITVTPNTLDPPTAPQDVTATPDRTQITLSWTESPAEQQVTHYEYTRLEPVSYTPGATSWSIFSNFRGSHIYNTPSLIPNTVPQNFQYVLRENNNYGSFHLIKNMYACPWVGMWFGRNPDGTCVEATLTSGRHQTTPYSFRFTPTQKLINNGGVYFVMTHNFSSRYGQWVPFSPQFRYGGWNTMRDSDITTTDGTTKSYTITDNLVENVSYAFRIRAVNTTGNGAESSEVTAALTTVPTSAAPASVTLTADTDNINPYTATQPHRTSDATPTVSFTAVANATTTAEWKRGSGSFSSAGITVTGTGTTTARTVTFSNAFTINGTYQIKITQDDDGAGTNRPASVTYEFVFDDTAPVLTLTKTRTGSEANYRVRSTDISPVTGRTKDNVPEAVCTAPELAAPTAAASQNGATGTRSTITVRITAVTGLTARLYADSSCTDRHGTNEATVSSGTADVESGTLHGGANSIYAGAVDSAGDVRCYATPVSYTRATGAILAANLPASLTEYTVNTATVDVTLNTGQFNATLTPANFTTTMPGLTVSAATRQSASTARLTLAYDGTNFDADTAFSVIVPATEYSGGSALTTTTLAVTAVAEPEKPVIALTSDTGISATDNLTNTVASFLLAVPSAQQSNIVAAGTAAVYRYNTVGGNCAAPTGSNTGWATHASESDHTGYSSTAGIWTVDGGTNPDDGTHCYTAVYDPDGTTTTVPTSRYADPIKVETDDTEPASLTQVTIPGGFSGTSATAVLQLSGPTGNRVWLFYNDIPGCSNRMGTGSGVLPSGLYPFVRIRTQSLNVGVNDIFSGTLDDAGNVNCYLGTRYTRAAASGTATVAAANPSSPAEDTLNTATVDVTVASTQFAADATLQTSHFTTDGIEGLTVSGYNRTSNTVVRLTLAFDGTDFDTAESFSINIAAAAHTGTGDISTSDSVSVSAVNDPPKPTISLTNDSGGSSTDGITDDATSFTLAVPPTQWENIASGSTAAVYRYNTTAGVCDTPTGSNNGWATHASESDSTGYDVGYWTVDGGTTPSSGTHCYTAVYDTDGTTTTLAPSHYADAVKVEISADDGWTAYTPGDLTGTAHDTNGRCVIVTDAPGNMTKLHITDAAAGVTVRNAVTNIGLQAGSDSGTADDDITNDTTAPVIEFSQVSGATVTARYKKTGGSWITAGVTVAATGTAGTVTLPDLTDGDGTYEVEITQQETGQSSYIATYTFTLDTAEPTVSVGAESFSPRITPLKFSEGGDVSVTLRGTSGADGDYFGSSTALSGDGTLLAVGARDHNPYRTGAVFLFEKSNGAWSQILKIFNKTGAAGAGELDVAVTSYSYFGSGTALSSDGTLLAVGAYGGTSNKGSVYLFEETAGIWSQTLKIFDKATAAGAGELDISLAANEHFGKSTALSADGTLLAVGARGNTSYKGAVYLFEKTGGSWSQTLKISDNSGGTGELDIALEGDDHFGSSVALSGDGTLLAVGTEQDDDGGTNAGAVYLFEKKNNTWSQALKISDNSGAGHLRIDNSNGDNFGTSVALSGTTRLAVGSRSDDDGANNTGSVYVFEKSGGAWSQTLKIADGGGGGKLLVDLDENDYFGSGVAFSDDGTTLAIGAERDDDGDNKNSGAVYLYGDPPYARSASVRATDDETGDTDWDYVITTGNVCTAAQFSLSPTDYTEGAAISFTSERDTGKRVCFRTTDAAGNAAVYTLTDPVKTIDRTAPVLNAVRVGTGTTADYRVDVLDNSPVTGRTKDNVAESACTADLSTSGWAVYTPGDLTGTADDTNGRCVIFTDAADNAAAQHLSDGDTAIASDISLRAVAGDGQITLLWMNPADSTITRYEYRRKEGSGSYGAWTPMVSSATTTHYNFTRLTNGTDYSYRIRTRHGGTTGAASREVSATPTADNTAPTLGTVTAGSTDGILFNGINHLSADDTVTVTVPVIDASPPSTAPTLTVKFGAAGTERTAAAGTPTLSYGTSGVVSSYPYTYTLQPGEIGTLHYKVTAVTDTAATPNSMTDQAAFSTIATITTATAVYDIGIQAGSDSGADDDITNDSTAPVIEFTQVSGATVNARYKKAGGTYTAIQPGSITATGTAGTITLPDLTAGDGDYEVEITQQETGKPSASASYTLTLDTTAPTVLTTASPYRPRHTPLRIGENGDVPVTLAGNDNFGSAASLSADGTLIAVGAKGDTSNKGAVYLFENDEGVWTESLKISDNESGTDELDIPLEENDAFGTATALSADGTLLAVGTPADDDTAANTGAVYLFENNAGIWTRTLKISDNSAAAGELDIALGIGDLFGSAVALSADGTLLAVGAYGDNGGGGTETGAVYLFEKRDGEWTQTLKIFDKPTADGAAAEGEIDIALTAADSFGIATALSADGTLLAVGAIGDTSKGAVYLFENNAGTWSQSLKISDNSGGIGELRIALGANDYFGRSAAFSADGTMLAVGASTDDDGDDNAGAVYLFENNAGTWSRTLKISENSGGTGNIAVTLNENDYLGTATGIAANGTLMTVGAYGTDSGKGAVYLYPDTGAARTVSYGAFDGKGGDDSVWEYMTTTGNACGAAQFSTPQTVYTEWEQISFSTEADNGKKLCFKATDTAGNPTAYALTDTIKTIDRTAPVLTATRIGDGATRDYRVRADDDSVVTGRMIDNTEARWCRAVADTSLTGWTDFTPGGLTGGAHDTNGKCVIVTDGAGNIATIHLSDGAEIPVDFTLDLDGNGSYDPNTDGILLYLYTNQGLPVTSLIVFTHDNSEGTVVNAVNTINSVKNLPNTPLDMDGNGTFTPDTDGIIPYLYTGQGYPVTSIVPFTHNQREDTAVNAVTRIRGNLTPNWP